jgi:hypothetical protein
MDTELTRIGERGCNSRKESSENELRVDRGCSIASASPSVELKIGMERGSCFLLSHTQAKREEEKQRSQCTSNEQRSKEREKRSKHEQSG